MRRRASGSSTLPINANIVRPARPPTNAGSPSLYGLPLLGSDYRDTTGAMVHKDLRLCFDGNRHCVPPRYVGRRLTVKADSHSVSIYDQSEEIVCYARSL
jgi:hypothetical protein